MIIEGEKPAVRDRDPVRVAGQVGEHGLGAGEGTDTVGELAG